MEYWNKPCAANGLTSYRYKGDYGYIMVGALNHHLALQEVLRSVSSGIAEAKRLEVWDFYLGQYVPANIN